ncbi:uncharacterized protein G2W53_041937 [Senna tora]|uniref:Uncharacterized protein n=1 Tax=Senna tora TaxID=362788 RepID=A0A834SGH9_9FABA|nr:uncharacterized protein G2W53_041937 [Senna tora]
MGHKEKYDMWSADPNVRLEHTLKPIVDDRGAMEMGLVGLAVAPNTYDGKDNDGVEEDNDGDVVEEDNEEDNDGDDDKEDGDQSDDSDDDSDPDSAADIRFNDSEEEDIEKDYFDSGDGAKEQKTKRCNPGSTVKLATVDAPNVEDVESGGTVPKHILRSGVAQRPSRTSTASDSRNP